jgi:transcription initiation factor TFIID subunit 13
MGREPTWLCGWQAAEMADEDEDPTFEEENEEIGGGAEGGHGKRKRLFSKECMDLG